MRSVVPARRGTSRQIFNHHNNVNPILPLPPSPIRLQHHNFGRIDDDGAAAPPSGAAVAPLGAPAPPPFGATAPPSGVAAPPPTGAGAPPPGVAADAGMQTPAGVAPIPFVQPSSEPTDDFSFGYLSS